MGRPGISEIILKDTGTGAMQVTMDEKAPIIHSYRLHSGEELAGETGDAQPIIRFCAVEDGKNYNSTESNASVEYTFKNNPGSVVYNGKLFWKGKEAANFSVTFTLSKNNLSMSCRLEEELPGFQLLSFETPAMLSVTGSGARLVIPTQSGRLVDVEKSEPRTQEIIKWFTDPARLAMVYKEEALGILTAESLDDMLFTSVSDEKPRKGKLWIRLVMRPEASKPDLQFIAQNATSCTITVIGKQNGKSPTWVDGAKAIRKGIKFKPDRFYTESFTMKIFCDAPKAEKFTTFDDCLSMIREIHALTGGIRQIVYLVGWQHTGHDTGYPDVFSVNERLGGEIKLLELIEKAKAYNAIVSFHDNYDDAYMNSPAWDPEYIARDSSGQLMKGWVWGGGQAYIISPLKYAAGAGAERIKKTLMKYPIKKTIHLDVLSVEVGRYDFNPQNPAGAQKNILGKYSILEQYRKHGVDPTSEALNSCFIGHISFFWHLLHNTSKCFSKEQPIPLVPFIYHSKAAAADTFHSDTDLLRGLLYGVTASEDFTRQTLLEHITDLYYLVNLPWSKLAFEEMTDYQKDGDTERVDYADGSYVKINTKDNTYTVVADEVTIGKDFTATVPLDKKTVAVYSRNGGDVSFTAPKSWELEDIKAYSLESDGSKKSVEIKLEGRVITLCTKANAPYRVSTN